MLSFISTTNVHKNRCFIKMADKVIWKPRKIPSCTQFTVYIVACFTESKISGV